MTSFLRKIVWFIAKVKVRIVVRDFTVKVALVTCQALVYRCCQAIMVEHKLILLIFRFRLRLKNSLIFGGKGAQWLFVFGGCARVDDSLVCWKRRVHRKEVFVSQQKRSSLFVNETRLVVRTRSSRQKFVLVFSRQTTVTALSQLRHFLSNLYNLNNR